MPESTSEDGLGRTFPSRQRDGISPSAPWGKLPWHISYGGPEVRETKEHKEIQKKAEDHAGPELTSSSGRASSSASLDLHLDLLGWIRRCFVPRRKAQCRLVGVLRV